MPQPRPGGRPMPQARRRSRSASPSRPNSPNPVSRRPRPRSELGNEAAADSAGDSEADRGPHRLCQLLLQRAEPRSRLVGFRQERRLRRRGGAWKLTGEMDGGGKVEITLADEASAGTFPQGAVKLEPNQDLDQQLGPAGSGGLLVALHLWRHAAGRRTGEIRRRLLLRHRAVSRAIEGQADVLVATRNVAEVNLVFDPATGQLRDRRDDRRSRCRPVRGPFQRLSRRRRPAGSAPPGSPPRRHGLRPDSLEHKSSWRAKPEGEAVIRRLAWSWLPCALLGLPQIAARAGLVCRSHRPDPAQDRQDLRRRRPPRARSLSKRLPDQRRRAHPHRLELRAR